MKFLQDILEGKITKLRDERHDVEHIISGKWYPSGSFGYAKLALALAIIDLKIELWQAFIGEAIGDKENPGPRMPGWS